MDVGRQIVFEQISDSYKFLFVHIPKTGGSALEEMFRKNRICEGNVLGHTTAMEYREKFPERFEIYFKFAFVRNPWDRLVSAFFYLRSGLGRSRTDKKIGESIKTYSFSDFVKNIDGFLHTIVHLRPQFTFICDDDGKVLVDFIGRFENIKRDYTRICRKVGMPSMQLPHSRRTTHLHYSSYYTEETGKIIAERYSKDIEMFGYEFERAGRLYNSKRQVTYLIFKGIDLHNGIISLIKRKMENKFPKLYSQIKTLKSYM